MRFPSPAVCLAVSFLAATSLTAQVVNFPDGNLVNPPNGQYPVFTPSNGNTVRAQIFCPSSFAGLPKSAALVTKVGIQIAGKLPYTTFVGRAGATSISALGTNFATNLPDQRVQFDLSGQNLPGGGSGTTASTQKNVWVEFDLCHPFVWKPGQGLIVDITSKSRVAGQYCRTAIGSGVTRMLNTAYTSSTTTGTVRSSGGIKLRFVFAPLYTPIAFGKGCPGTNNLAPVLTGKGSTKLGSSGAVTWNLTQARANATNFLVLGVNCLDLPIFGGCEIYPQPLILVGGKTSATGTAGGAAAVPSNTALDGTSITLQYVVDDPNTKAKPLTFTLSNGLRLVLNK